MDSVIKLKKENPKKSANILSRLFFTWMVKLFYKGVKEGIDVVDLYKPLDVDKSAELGDRIERNWNEEVARAKLKKTNPSLLRVICKTFIWKYMVYGILLFVQFVIIRAAQPIVLSLLIRLFGTDDRSQSNEMYIYGSSLVLLSLCFCTLNHHVAFGQYSIGMRVRISVSSLIYRKLMRLNKLSMGQTAAGQIINILSNDVSRFDLVTSALHFFWIMPFQVIIVTYLLWQQVGISCLAGVLSMAAFTLPIQAYLGKLTSHLRLLTAQRTDFRVKLMNEVIQGIQVIKMYAWEKPFEKLVALARKKEISAITKTSYLRGIYSSAMVFIERTTLYATCVTFVLTDNVLTADLVFPMAQFFNMLQFAMSIAYPVAITYGAESLVAIKRLQDFLMLEERPEPNIEIVESPQITLTNIEASYNEEKPILKNITFHVPKGSLCAIVGPVGAGKSSVLQLLLGELTQTSGRIRMGGHISYCSQEPWLFQSTVRQNILFGLEYNRIRYKNIVRVCALLKDFEQFPLGDKTIVGERGVSLSGGQRARINLARAVYRDSDIYLLDDPLSAVDTHVGRELFNNCIVRFLKEKTRILVTHQLQYLKEADFIIVLNDGGIEAQGTFQELTESNSEFTKMLIASNNKDEKEKEEHIFARKGSTSSVLSSKSEDVSKDDDKVNEEEVIISDSAPIKKYFEMGNNTCLLGSLIFSLILAQAFCTGADYWVTFWTQEEALRHTSNSNYEFKYETGTDNFLVKEINETLRTDIMYKINEFLDSLVDHLDINDQFYTIIKTEAAIYIYTILIIGSIAITILRSMLFFKFAMCSSKNLHNRMFHNLLETPMRFFDANPSGRVLNRFSKDMGSIDEILPRVLLEAIQILLVAAGILVMVTVANYYMVCVIVILGAVFIKLRSWFISTAKVIKHIEGITKSPVFSHVNSSLNGLITIRSARAEQILISEFDQHQDVHTSAWFLTIMCTVSFGLWLDIICCIFVGCVTFSFIILHLYSIVSGSLVGLAISQSLILTGMLQYGMRQSAEVVNQLTSVERVLQYTKLEKEGPFESPQDSKSSDVWPSEGLVQFKNLYLRYSTTEPPILKNLNFTVLPAEKIGIVGRTGAGKSSLIAALFRLAPLEGNIYIDGKDCSTLGLIELRKNIAIIPQEPVLFSSTLRYNLDPFDEYEDPVLWSALEDVELKDSIDSLDMQVTEGGSNFSLGQRQLLCLARAIIRNNKILVLDEATANVDPRTDALIQATIRKKFKNCSVFTIAHRLNTIMDSDKVLVMDSGNMVEFDHPHILLQNPDGHFSRMVAETGVSMTLQLKDAAQEAYNSTHKNM